MSDGHLLVGVLTRAHGIRGELLVEVTTDRPDEVFAEGRRLMLGTADGEPSPELGTLTVVSSRPLKRGRLVHFQEVLDRTIAESLRGRTLLIPREEAEPTRPDEYFVHDLIGLEARDVDGEPIGRVVQVYEVGPGHMLEIRDERGEHLLPFRKGIVKRVDLEEGVVVVEPPEGWPV